MTRPQLLHLVGSYVGGFSSFVKLYSFVPYQTYISVSELDRHFAHVIQSPLCPSLWWNEQSVKREWLREQLLRA